MTHRRADRKDGRSLFSGGDLLGVFRRAGLLGLWFRKEKRLPLLELVECVDAEESSSFFRGCKDAGKLLARGGRERLLGSTDPLARAEAERPVFCDPTLLHPDCFRFNATR